MSDPLRLEIDGPLARLTLDRPPLNVLTIEMLIELAERLEQLAAADGIRLVRIDAVGTAFSAGVDVADHLGDRVEPMLRALERLFDAFELVPVPVVAVVDGPALGGGCELVLGCDLCLASERATFGQPEIKLGVFAPPASVLLPRAVGPRRAMELLWTGRTVGADEALGIGLVSRVFPVDRFADEVERWQRELLGLSGAALRQAKRAVVATLSVPPAAGRRAVARLYVDELMRTEDAEEGLRAFVDKRAPRWKHR